MPDERAVTPQGQGQNQQVGIDLPGQKVLAIQQVAEGVERVEQTVIIPPIYMYSMWRPQGQPPKVSLTSEAYSFLNRVMGVQLFQPEKVNDTDGSMANNPIHRPDYIYVRLVGVWRNDLGQLVSYREDVEVDYNLVYQDARINAKSARVATDKDGAPIFENGLPKLILDPADELKALKALSQLRTFGLRYAQTVAATRILKRASGLSSLPIPSPQPFPVRVVGFRDQLSPDERQAQAEKDLESMFGKGEVLPEAPGLTTEELSMVQEFEPQDFTEDVEREMVQRNVEAQADEPRFDAPIRRVSPDEIPTEGLFEEQPKKRRQG